MRTEEFQKTDPRRADIECGLREIGDIPVASSEWVARVVSFLEEGPSGWSAKWDGGILTLGVPLLLDDKENRVVLKLGRVGITVLGEGIVVYSRSGVLGCDLKIRRMSPTQEALVLTTEGGNKISLVRDASGKTSLQVKVA